MILADTSIWIGHLRRGDPLLAERLGQGRIIIHDFVIGEVALGSLRQRDRTLADLRTLPRTVRADDHEVRFLIESAPLHGLGIGYIDAHLLAAVRLTPGATFWTRDRHLHAAADRLGLAAPNA